MALEKSASKNEEATDRRLASLAKVSASFIWHKRSTDNTQDPLWHTKYKIERFDGPTTLRLIQIDEHDNVAEEAVFSVQGILSVKNLPPITEKIK